METYKQQLLKKVQQHIAYVKEKLATELASVRVFAERSLKEIYSMRPDDQALYMDLKRNAVNRVAELTHLSSSPYFMRCEITESDTGENKEYFFGKHQFSEESIYSWVAPVASVRFENPGAVSYTLPSGEVKNIVLHSKQQYMIVDGKVLFFAEEKENAPRELIYQEHFTVQKSEFILPEIVAQMEKAQDKVIRAHHKGPLVISGPAGSGKTTLALHRVAYLTQAPETSSLYTTESIIVFVQDNGTKEYFSHLLPGLGIHNVTITTFSEWAFSILGLKGYTYENRLGDSEELKDMYEYQKLSSLREGPAPVHELQPFQVLCGAYSKKTTVQTARIFEFQKKNKILDRFDLTILLRSYLAKHEKFEIRREYMTYVGETLKKKTKKTPVLYSLMVIDEFQNYLPEQLMVFKENLHAQTQSIIYVGDMAQQVQLGTLKKWEDIRESITAERNVRLDKVYRNTKNILAFIQSLGYTISIPDGIKEGPVVTEEILENASQEIEHIKKHLPVYKAGSIGILSKKSDYLEPFRKAFKGEKNIHVLTMNESQGVEFDLVCIVGINADTFKLTQYADVSLAHLEERKRMQKDLLYVALTRAITELHILGKETLSTVLK